MVDVMRASALYTIYQECKGLSCAVVKNDIDLDDERKTVYPFTC